MGSRIPERKGQCDRLANTFRGVTLVSRWHVHSHPKTPLCELVWVFTREVGTPISATAVSTSTDWYGNILNRIRHLRILKTWDQTSDYQVCFLLWREAAMYTHPTVPLLMACLLPLENCVLTGPNSLHYMPLPYRENIWQKFLEIWQQSWNLKCYCLLGWGKPK